MTLDHDRATGRRLTSHFHLMIRSCSFVTKMAHHIKVKAEDQQTSSSSSLAAAADDDEESLLVQLCPQFVWSVRDFTLQLDLDGKQATPDEYLERCLQEKPGKDDCHLSLSCVLRSCSRPATYNNNNNIQQA